MIQPSSIFKSFTPPTEKHAAAEKDLNKFIDSANIDITASELFTDIKKYQSSWQEVYNKKLHTACWIALKRPVGNDLKISKLRATRLLLTTAKPYSKGLFITTAKSYSKRLSIQDYCDTAIDHLKTWQEKLALDIKNNHFIYRL